MQQRHTDRRLYFEELAATSQEFYLSYLSKFTEEISGQRIFEIGCGEGGNLLPFAKKQCYVCGVDTNQEKILAGQQYFKELNLNADLISEDFFLYAQNNDSKEKFDIILIHDVIEHIPAGKKEKFLLLTKQFLKPKGVIFIAFPAWQMPFGGHQQIASGFVSKIPYIHLLPKRLYRWLLSVSGEETGIIEELFNVRNAKMPIEKFEKLYHSCNLSLLHRQLWFINPHYKQKFHLKPRKQSGIIANIPYIRNFFTTSCWYLLQ